MPSHCKVVEQLLVVCKSNLSENVNYVLIDGLRIDWFGYQRDWKGCWDHVQLWEADTERRMFFDLIEGRTTLRIDHEHAGNEVLDFIW